MEDRHEPVSVIIATCITFLTVAYVLQQEPIVDFFLPTLFPMFKNAQATPQTGTQSIHGVSDPLKQELLGLRDQITERDHKIIQLLGERQSLILRVGELKRANKLPVRDTAREKALLESLVVQAQKEKLSSELVVQIYRLIIEASVADQNSLVET